MDTFADYILDEKNLAQKMEIVYYLSKKQQIFYDKSVILKTELARLFIKYNKLDVDENIVLTASLLCNCMKAKDATDLETIKNYAKRGADYLEQLGFDKRFCKICEEINRYSGSEPREKESDVLELVDCFGGMIIDRPERIGFEADEALVLLEHRNLKDKYNRYSDLFVEFIKMLQEIKLGDFVEIDAIKKLVKMHNESNDIIEFIKKDINQYEPEVDKKLNKKFKLVEENMFKDVPKQNRPLFTEETTKMVLEKIKNSKTTMTEKI